jgi:hypothetical protein
MADYELFVAHGKKHRDSFVYREIVNPAITDAPRRQRRDGDGIGRAEMDAKFGEELRVERAFGGARIKVDLERTDLRLMSRREKSVQSLIELGGIKRNGQPGVRVDANDCDHLYTGSKQ